METLFEIPPKYKKLRGYHGRYCTKKQAEIDRRFKLITKVEHQNSVLKHQVEYWRRQAESLQNILINKTHGITTNK